MKGYIVISYIKDSLCYNFRKITKEEKKYVNSNSLYKDSLFYSLNYLKKNINKISSTIKNNFNEINYFIVRTTVTFKYVKMLMEKLSCNKLRLLFEYSISIEDYNLLSSIKDLKEIDVYFMPTFIINRFESLNIKVITHYTNKISSKFMLEQDSIDYDTLYYRKKLYITDDYEELEEDKKIFGRRNNNNKVVTMPGQGQPIRMVISQPTTFEQSDEICSFLKEKKSVIVNLEYVNKDVARRIVDFISGGVYALDGYIQKVSNSIFLVAPSNYEITNEMAREEIKNKLSVSWLKNNGVN